MNKKAGITVSVLIIAMAIMSIVLSTALITGSSSVVKATLDKFDSTMTTVGDATNLYYEQNGDYPIYLDGDNAVEIQVDSMEESLKNDIYKASDYQQTFYVLDTRKLGISNLSIGTTYGAANVILAKKDVFLINTESGKIYYYAGVKSGNTKIHCIED